MTSCSRLFRPSLAWATALCRKTFEFAPPTSNYTRCSRQLLPVLLWSSAWPGTVALLLLICYPLAYGMAKLFGRWSHLLTLLW